MGYQDTWSVSSNKESEDDYSDILVEIDDEEMGIVIEFKYPEDGNLDTGCEEAMR